MLEVKNIKENCDYKSGSKENNFIYLPHCDELTVDSSHIITQSLTFPTSSIAGWGENDMKKLTGQDKDREIT